MSTLRQLQQQFSAHLLQGDPAIAAHVASASPDDGDERLGVYAHAYRQRLRDVLREEFSGLHALAGDAQFTPLIDAYLDAHPSRHPNIRWLGATMANWLAEPATPVEPERAAWAAMAALDWDISTCFDGADSNNIDASDLATLTAQQWPELRLHMNPAVQRLTLEWNVDALRIALDNEETLPALQAEDAFTVAIWRKDFGVRHRRLDADEAASYAAAVDGANFGELCGLLCAWHDMESVAARAVFLLQRWVAAGWIASLDVASAD